MPRVLIISSFVAASRVGGYAQALALAAFGIDAVVAPTVVFGRHPGWGSPGGGALGAAMLEGVLAGVQATGVLARMDAVLTGYFASADQVAAAADTIDRTRDASPGVRVIVDPILGDYPGGLYVKPEVETAIVSLLIPRANLLAPNAWELERLTGLRVSDAPTARKAARTLGRPVLASSIPLGEEIGVMYADDEAAWLVSHRKSGSAPNGTGDLLTALFVAALMEKLPPPEALARASAGVLAAVEAAAGADGPELPIVQLGAHLRAPAAPVHLESMV